MPIYEYMCRKCEETFEVMQKVNEDGKDLHCPKCGSDEPQRLLSAFCSGSPKGSAGPAPSAHSSAGHS